jgi:radical SAM superfamily enzyme YgiQ (UPF0313 family)
MMRIECLSNPLGQQVDVIITTVPWTDSSIPLMAPATMKPIVEGVGLTCLAVDFNAEIYNWSKTHANKQQLTDFFFHGTASSEIRTQIRDIIELSARSMLSWKPKFIGLSLFSYISRHYCEWLCYYIKKLSPDVKIIIGGAGCLEQFTGPSTFADSLLDRGLVDYHIRGDGEHALRELLSGNPTYPGINSSTWKILNNQELDQLPYPDYTDYDFSKYNKAMLGLLGSRGCVRTCTFCDYIVNWEKFQWRTGQSIFEEMKLQYDRFGIRSFKFQDSLTNGNLKEFNKLIRLLADYNENNPHKSFNWGGYYIFREQTAHDDEMWEIMARSGVDVVMVGIENLNEDIRYAIGKKFSNASITYHLKQAQRHKIKTTLLFIVGYISETQQHIENAKSWLDQHVQYQDTCTLSWGGTLGIFPNTYLDKNSDQLGITRTGGLPQFWINNETGSTPALRAKWVNDLIQYSQALGYDVRTTPLDTHWVLEQLIKTNE